MERPDMLYLDEKARRRPHILYQRNRPHVARTCGGGFADGSSGVGSAVDGEVGTGNVGRFRSGDERHEGGDLVNGAVALQRCESDLGLGPIACGGVEVGVDWAGLYVVDGDAANADLPGQS